MVLGSTKKRGIEQRRNKNPTGHHQTGHRDELLNGRESSARDKPESRETFL